MQTSPQSTIVPPGTGRTFSAFGDEVTILLGAAETGGAYMCANIVTQPGGGPPPHCHEREDEWFIIQEGRAAFFADGVRTDVGPGTVVFLPKGSHHHFQNIGDTPLRMLLHLAPAGFEVFYERISEAYHQPEGPDMARILEISAEHGITYPEAG